MSHMVHLMRLNNTLSIILLSFASSAYCSDDARFIGANGSSGVIHLGERHYSPSLGRFISQDGVKQLYSHYNYTNGSVILMSDSTGMAKENKNIKARYQKLEGEGSAFDSSILEFIDADVLEGDINKIDEDIKKIAPPPANPDGTTPGVKAQKKNNSVIQPTPAPGAGGTFEMQESQPFAKNSGAKRKVRASSGDYVSYGTGDDGFKNQRLTAVDTDLDSEENPENKLTGSAFNRIRLDETSNVRVSEFDERNFVNFNHSGAPYVQPSGTLNHTGRLARDESRFRFRLKKRIGVGVGIGVIGGLSIFGIVELSTHKSSGPNPAPQPCTSPVSCP